MSRSFRKRLLGASLAWLIGATAVQAQEASRLSIPAQPMTTAVLQLGAQARVSVGAQAVARCGRSSAVVGNYTVEAALRIMLEGSNCIFRRIDRRTWLIVAQPPPRPAPFRRPAPPPAPPAIVSALDDVVVTATRREIDLAGAPYALSAVDGASFDAAARRDTSALATRLAGLTAPTSVPVATNCSCAAWPTVL